MILRPANPSQKLLLHFHGNGEDVKGSSTMLNSLKCSLQVSTCFHPQATVISLEYPGYGCYIGSPSSARITQDAKRLYQFATRTLGYKEQHIIVFGRSIGSGPATLLAASNRPGALVLISPFTTLRRIIESMVGKYLSYTVKDRFRNIDEIKKVKCPVFILHGKADKIIPYQQSQQLACKVYV
jgi:abhydrolase domain-containing protein 17